MKTHFPRCSRAIINIMTRKAPWSAGGKGVGPLLGTLVNVMWSPWPVSENRPGRVLPIRWGWIFQNCFCLVGCSFGGVDGVFVLVFFFIGMEFFFYLLGGVHNDVFWNVLFFFDDVDLLFCWKYYLVEMSINYDCGD